MFIILVGGERFIQSEPENFNTDIALVGNLASGIIYMSPDGVKFVLR